MDAVSQETLRALLPSKVALTVGEIARQNGTDPVAELQKFYASATYRALEDEKSKYWWFSPAELSELYLRGEQNGNGEG